MPWKPFLKDYFSFSRSERFGILGLCGCILLVVAIRLLLPHLIERKVADTSLFEKEIAQFLEAVDSVHSAGYPAEPPEYSQLPADLFYFDPNHATDQEWGKLGLNSRQIKNIRNYQAKGGRFKQKEDLQKLYTIPVTQYKLLEPYISIARNEVLPKKQPEAKPTITNTTVANVPESKTIHIELNTADSAMLVQLHGIGPVFASRIIKYRNRIGGFAHVDQLGEVYGLKPDLVDRLAPQLSVDGSLVKQIPVNTATFRDLVIHPYFTEQQTKGILNYRRLQGRLNGLDELVRNHILTQEEATKIEPYVAFD